MVLMPDNLKLRHSAQFYRLTRRDNNGCGQVCQVGRRHGFLVKPHATGRRQNLRTR